MATDAKNHVVPAATDAPSRAELLSLSLSIRDIVYVADSTARANVVSQLSAAGQAVSSSNPLYVHRADKVAGQELEYSLDGTNWTTVYAGDTNWVNYTGPGTGWGAYSGGGTYFTTPKLRKIGNRVEMKGLLAVTGTPISSGVCTIPTAYAPTNQKGFINRFKDSWGWYTVANTGAVGFSFGGKALTDLVVGDVICLDSDWYLG